MTTVSARDWQVGDNGLSRWDWNCDFNGRDIGTSPASGELNLLNLDALTLLTAMELVTRIALPTESSMAIQLHPDGFVVTFQIVSMGAVKQLLIFVKENDIDPFFKMLKNVELEFRKNYWQIQILNNSAQSPSFLLNVLGCKSKRFSYQTAIETNSHPNQVYMR